MWEICVTDNSMSLVCIPGALVKVIGLTALWIHESTALPVVKCWPTFHVIPMAIHTAGELVDLLWWFDLDPTLLILRQFPCMLLSVTRMILHNMSLSEMYIFEKIRADTSILKDKVKICIHVTVISRLYLIKYLLAMNWQNVPKLINTFLHRSFQDLAIARKPFS